MTARRRVGATAAGRGVRAAALALVAAALLGAVAAAGCSHSAHDSTLSLVDADSLIIPFGDLAQTYQQLHPGVHVETETHGSIQTIRQVTDLGRSFDVLTSADPYLVTLMMEDAEHPTAHWYAVFATNRMVLAWAPHSRYAALFRSGDWIKAITTPGVQFGLADPRFDATGYRALMVLALAQRYYHDDHLFADVTVGRFSPPITLTSERDGREVIDVPQLLEAASGTGLVLRDTAIELETLLEAGDIDCTFEYESVARQHHMPFVALPAAVDLGSQRYATEYAKVAVATPFQRFASVKPLFVGAPIAYAVTIPSTARDPAEAQRFIAFLLGPRGRAILAADDQPTVTPALVDHDAALPALLRPLCRPLRPGQEP
jgi:molybdate/tungstate transport system substrate-binding protein